MGIKNTTGGKTLPKRGRLGSGAYYPRGVPIAGNIFGPNTEQALTSTPSAPRVFGTPTNAGNGTQFGQNRVTLGADLEHPNAGNLPISKIPKVPAFTIGGNGQHESPYGVNNTPVIQPQERNFLRRKITPIYKMQSGAGRTVMSDTAFHRKPPKVAPRTPPPPQQYVLRDAARIPSFVSRNNQWSDPNNSFQGGKRNIHGEIGRGRWRVIKRGAAG
jgi:hypothetical protein